jgi:protocatechuate 3,4-dioxygenase beta subunit
MSTARAELPPQRLAVLAGKEIRQTGLPDLLFASLGAHEGVSLVERAALNEVLREQSLSAAFGSDAPATRIRLGRLLSADVLLLLRVEPEPEPTIRVVVADAKTGARLGQASISQDGKLADLAEAINTFYQQLRERFPAGVQQMIAIPPLISQSLVPDTESQGRALAGVLSGLAWEQTGVAVLEVEEAQAIREELRLTGNELESVPIPVIVEGVYRLEGTPGQAQRKCAMRLLASNGDKELGRVERDFESFSELVTFLRSDAWKTLLGTSVEAASLAPGVVAERLTARGGWFYLHGERQLAIDNWQAAILIDPAARDAVLALCNTYVEMIRGREYERWYSRPRAEVRHEWSMRPRLFVEGLETLEQAYRRGAVPPWHAYELYRALDSKMRRFQSRAPGDPPTGFDVSDPELLALVDEGLAHCSAVARHWHREVLPMILASEPETWPQRYRQTMGGQSAGKHCFETMLEWPDYSRGRWPMSNLNPVSAADLAHQLDMLTRFREERRWVACHTLMSLVRLVAHGERHADLTDTEIDAFLSGLEDAGGPLLPLYAAWGRALRQAFTSSQDRHLDAGTARQELESIDRQMRSITADKCFALGKAAAQLHARATAQQAHIVDAFIDAPVVGKPVDRPPLFEEPRPRRNPIVTLERIPFRVRRTNGEVVRFDCSGWTDQHGFMHGLGGPQRMLGVEDRFDVVWNSRYLLWHGTPGMLKEIATAAKPNFKSVKWDGERIWVGTLLEGIWLLDGKGNRLDVIDHEDGLPPADHAMTIQTLAPGRALVTGEFGQQHRVWSILVELTPAGPKLESIHEATKVVGHQFAHDGNPNMVFSIFGSGKYRDPLLGSRTLVLIGRQEVRDREFDKPLLAPLAIDPETRRVEVLGAGFSHMGMSGDALQSIHQAPHYLPDGSWLLVDRHAIKRHFLPGSIPADSAMDTTLMERPIGRFHQIVCEHDGYGYLAGDRWHRIDLDSFAVQDLGPPTAVEPRGEDRYVWERLGVSAHFGLMHWTGYGRYSKVHIDEAPLAPTQPPPPVRKVQVVDAKSGAPLPEAVVEQTHQYAVHSTSVDEAARCALASDLGTVALRASCEGYADATAIVRGGRHRNADDGVLTLPLSKVLTIGGRIVDERGTPIPDAQVIVKTAERRGLTSSGLSWRRAYGDEQGRWQLNILAGQAEWPEISLGVSLDSNSTRGSHPFTKEEQAALLAGEHTYTYDLRGSARGRQRQARDESASTRKVRARVVNEADQPVAGARVRTLPIWAGAQAATVTTDADGWCEITADPLPIVHIQVNADGFAPHVTDVKWQGPQTPTEKITLSPAKPLQGVVQDAEGSPLADATVAYRALARDTRFRGRNERPPLVLADTRTDAQGCFAFDQRLDGAVELVASKPGFVPADKATTDDDGGLAFVLQTERVIRVWGTVTDANTDSTIDYFRVRMYGRRDQVGNFTLPQSEAYQNGTYEYFLREPGEHVILEVVAKGHHRERTEFTLDGRTDVELNIALRPEESLRGVVLDVQGRPAANVPVSTMTKRAELRAFPFDSSTMNSQKFTRTDGDGKFSMTRPIERYLLAAIDESGYARRELEPVETEVTLHMQPFSTITGRWRHPDGEAIVLTLRAPYEQPASDSLPILASNSRTIADTETGEFRFEHVLPARYILSRTGPDKSRANRLYLTVEPGEHPVVEVGPAGRPVQGHVDVPDGFDQAVHVALYPTAELETRWNEIRRLPPPERAAAEFAFLESPAGQHWARLERCHAEVQPTGEFHFDRVPAGSARLRLSAHGLESRQVEVEIPPWPDNADLRPFDLGRYELQPKTEAASAGPSLPPWNRMLQFGAAGLLAIAIIGYFVRHRMQRAAQGGPA